jgi:hypothetical protein
MLWGNAAMAMSLNSPAFQQNGRLYRDDLGARLCDA